MVETSMVLILLTAIIIGIMQTTTLLSDSKLSRAKTLTQQSPVKDTKGLILWLETSLEESFLLSEIEDNSGVISVWRDIKNNALKNNDATQSNANNKPTYQINEFNESIPAIRFDGTNDYLNFDGTKLINSPYTIFIVDKRTSSKSNNYFIAGTGTVPNQNLILGYNSNVSIMHSHSSNDLTHTITGYNQDIVRIHTFEFNMSGKRYYLNGGESADKSDSITNPIGAFNSPTIGRYLAAPSYYQGDIAEIIMFNKILKRNERQAIEEYLSKKYDITLN